MKKNYYHMKCARLLMLCLAVFFSFRSTAQVSAYTYTTTNGTYVPITGGTDLFGTSWDDVRTTGIPIGFNFYFAGTPYSNLNVTSNGYIWFGSNTMYNYEPIVSSEVADGAIAGFGRDLIDGGTTSGVSYKLIGTAPNRKFVIQWKNARRFNISGDVLNFQIILNETTNQVDVMYGTCSATSSSTGFGQIGLRGTTNSDFNNLTGPSNAPWTTLTSGVNNSDEVDFNSTAVPASGLTFSWLATGCFVPGSLNVSGISTTDATFSWGSLSSSFDIYYGLSTITPPTGTTVPTATTTSTSYSITGLTSSTSYVVYVRSTCGPGIHSAWTPAKTYLTPCSPTSVPYLQDFNSASTPSVPTCTSAENVGLGNIWETAGSPGYGFSSNVLNYQFNYSYAYAANSWFYLQGLNLTGGVSYRLTYTYGGSTTWTQENLEVKYGTSPSALDMTTPLTNHYSFSGTTPTLKYVDFTPPTTGVYYVGFHAYSNVYQADIFVDDISVDLSPSCIEPPTAAVQHVKATDGVANWTPGAFETAWDVYYGPAPLAIPSSTTVPTATASSPSYTLTGLTPSTPYEFYVRAHCSSTDQSFWVAANTFTTVCLPTNVPYLQDFNGASTPLVPSCTSAENVGSGNIWQTTGSPGYGFSSNVLDYQFDYSYAYAANSWFYLQGLNLTGGVSYRLTYTYGGSATWAQENLEVKFGSSPSDIDMTIPLTNHYNFSSITPTTRYVDFTPATTGVYYVGFHAYSDVYEADIFVDDISVDLSPTCIEPPSASVSHVDATNAEATWAIGASETAWDMYYGPAPLGVPSSTTVPTATSSATSYTLTGLTPSTPYEFYVRAHCSSTDQSFWVATNTFTTLCLPTNIPYTEDFESTSAPALPTCGSVETSGGGSAWQIANNPGNGFISNTLNYQFDYTYAHAANTWYYLQGLNMTAGTSYRLTYRYGNSNMYSAENLEVSYGMSAEASAMTNTLTNHPSLINDYPVSKYVDFTPTTTGVYYIGFHAYSNNYTNGIYVDDVTVNLSPTCIEPSDLVVSNVTSTTAVTNWIPGPAGSVWDVYYGPAPLSPPTASTPPTATVSASSYTLSGLLPALEYLVYVRTRCSSTDQSYWIGTSSFVTPCSPPSLISAPSDTRCGIGTASLMATADPGANVNWYTSLTSTPAISTNSVYTTPVISSTTNYYVSASNPPSVFAAGLVTPTGTVANSPSYEGLLFDVSHTFTLTSVDVFPNDASGGSLQIDLYDNSYNLVHTFTSNVPSGNGYTSYTIPLNFEITPGIDYRLQTTYGGPSLVVNNSNVSYPYPLGYAGSVKSGIGSSQMSTYYYFYNMQVTTVCESPRTMVTVTVTPPPALALSTGTAVCANVISTVSVTSTASNYDSYVWSPSTNLYLDAAATVPYTGAPGTVYYKSPIGGSTIYSVYATNSVSNCGNLASTTMVTDVPVIIPSATPSISCSGATSIIQALAIAPTPSVTPVGSATGFSDITGGPYRSGAGSDNRVQWLYTAAELSAAGLISGNMTSLAFNVTSLGSGTMNNFTIRIGTTSSTSLGTTFDATPSTIVYGPVAYTAVTAINTHTFSTPFFWDGVSNIIVQVCHDATSSGSSSLSREAISNRTIYRTSAGSCALATGTSEPYRPVIRFNGIVLGPASSGMNFSWNPGGVTTNTLSVNPVNTTTSPIYSSYTVTVTNPVTTCSNTAVTTLTTNPLPTITASANTTTVCATNPATLTATGGTSYAWSPAGGSSATAVVAPVLTTTYTVTGTVLGCSNTATVALTTLALPTLTVTASTPTLCSGNTVTLTATGSVSSYSWAPAGGNAITAVVSPTANTTYTMTGSNGICSNKKTVTVNLSPGPALTAVSSKSVICVGESVVLTAASTATNLAWSANAGSATTASVSVTPTITSTYTITATSSAICPSKAFVVVTVNPCTGIYESYMANGINVYPNPATTLVNIAMPAGMSQSSVEIYDAIGKLVMIENLSNEMNTISLSKLEDGIYFFKIMLNKEAIKIGKVVKQ